MSEPLSPHALLQILVDVASKFPTRDKEGKPVDASSMLRVFLDLLLERLTPRDKLIAVAKLIEKADQDTLLYMNAMTVKEAEKRGLKPP